MKRYLPGIKQYSWILLVCVVLSSLAGLYLAKSTPPVFLVSSTILVQTGAPGTSITTLTSSTDPTQSLAEANTYASEIPTREVMTFIFNQFPDINKHGFKADDLLNDVTAVASTTSATVAISASTTSKDNSVLLANDVADGFVLFSQQQSQDQLNAMRKNLTDQLTTYQQKQQQLEATLVKIGNTSDPNYIFTNNSLNSVNSTINTLQSQLLGLPATVRSDVTVIQYSEPQDATVASHTSLIVAATAAVGLIIGLLIMMLMIFLDDRLRSDDEVQKKLGMAYLGSVSSSRELGANPTRVSGKSLLEIGDIYAGLRLTKTIGNWQAPQGGVLLVTSAQAAEGKTTLAIALATSLASAGSAVVVVDGNLRKPGTHLAFGVGAAGGGLSSLLKSTSSLDDAVQRSKVPGVWLLSAGAQVPDPTFLLEQKLPTVLAGMRKKTDFIIIDGPSLLSSADALLLATMVDAVLLVVDVRHDKMALLKRAGELMTSLAGTPAGVVMNQVPRRKRNQFYAAASLTPAHAVVGAASPAFAQSHNGNGHEADNGQHADLYANAMPGTRNPASSPGTLGSNGTVLPLLLPVQPAQSTLAGRPGPAQMSQAPSESSPFPMNSGQVSRPVSGMGQFADFQANTIKPSPMTWAVPPSPGRIPPSPSRPGRDE